ncbi:olfactory receptor 11A1-like [Oncorhynchus tshawytscha]|uniref:G-protein coupled receptors family 1 profile domain-containing protein n=1 Tax=Oncorhynchus tshawytscha TaxID=74940 RepID=A0AAZ3SHZ7_ONCTS|nr:olfactory receptor 11A1-like [Oncorhynchus tshawytscha]
MMNSTQFTSFILAGYSDIGHLKYLYFIILTVLYVSIVFANTVLIVVICMERSLHEPMYLFLCSLFVNDLYGTTGLFPALMTHLVSDDHTVSTVCCYLQIFVLYTYGSTEFINLAVMSYDRYLAICYPLQYNAIMAPSKVCILICAIWLYSFVKFTIQLSLTIRLRLCGNVIDKVYCDNYLVVKLACSTSDTTVNNISGLCGIVLTVAVPLITIVFSYIQILTICLKSSIETRQKAFSTCSPHLVSLLNFSFGCFLTLLQSRFDSPMRNVPTVLHTILSVYYLMCQPLLNPIVYGVRMAKIRQACKYILPVGLYPKT